VKAWQKQIRDERSSSAGDLLGRWWDGIDCDISKSKVRPIDIGMAEKIILEYEWLKCMPAVVLHCYGIFFGEMCAGAVVYSPEYAENLGVWDKYGYTGKIICLARGACVHWAHPHSASRLIRGSMKLLPERYKVVTCTVDAEAGEVGTIYQACGFDYVGQMSAGGKRISYLHKGEKRSGRQAMRSFGTRGKKISEMGAAGVSHHHRKGRYFCFRGNKYEIAENREQIAALMKPYPKRDHAR
jgi:hypothetical protein